MAGPPEQMNDRALNKSLEEFSLIARLVAKLPQSRRTILGPGDDCAILTHARSPQIVTVDSMVEGVHFRLPWTTPEALGARALTVNLSDIAAMGGTPKACVVNLAIRPGLGARFFDRLYTGLAREAAAAKTDIVGGNITRASELTITITVMGEVPDGAMRRDTARAGDEIYVTGTLGDAAAGLRILSGELKARGQQRAFLVDRYLSPSARLEAGRHLARLRPLPSAIDISDGMLQDLGHILERSGVGAEIETAAVPLSEAYRAIVGDDPRIALGGGDDYELLFCLRTGQSERSLSRRLGLPVSRIGRITKGHHVKLLGGDGTTLPVDGIAGWNQLREH
jgi:thiamine-monophosphate kinase